MEKEMKLIDLAKIVFEAKLDEYIDFANGNIEEAGNCSGWCGVKRINAFDNDNLQFLVGHWGGEANVRFYAISEYDDRIGDFCAERMYRYKNGKYEVPSAQNYIECIARMLADFILDYEDYVSETITVDLPDEDDNEYELGVC